jgi:hypothetical protein
VQVLEQVARRAADIRDDASGPDRGRERAQHGVAGPHIDEVVPSALFMELFEVVRPVDRAIVVDVDEIRPIRPTGGERGQRLGARRGAEDVRESRRHGCAR